MANMSLTQTAVTLSAGVVTAILPRNDQRNYLCLQNVGSNDLQFGFVSTLTAGNGTTLSPGGLGKQGGFFLWDGNWIPANSIYAVSTSGTTIIAVEG